MVQSVFNGADDAGDVYHDLETRPVQLLAAGEHLGGPKRTSQLPALGMRLDDGDRDRAGPAGQRQ